MKAPAIWPWRRARCRPGRHSGPFADVLPSPRGSTPLRYCAACGTVLVPEAEIRSLNTELARLMR